MFDMITKFRKLTKRNSFRILSGAVLRTSHFFYIFSTTKSNLKNSFFANLNDKLMMNVYHIFNEN